VPDGAMGNALVWLGLAEDRNKAFFCHRYPPLTIPGPPMDDPPAPDPNKLAVVLQLIEDDDAGIRTYAARFLGEFAHWPEATEAATRLLDDANADVRQAATHALAEIGPPARAALPRLTELLQDTRKRYHIYAACALWKIDRRKETAVPVLARALRGRQRQWAMDVLMEMGPDAEGAFPELCATSQDGDRILRMYALRTLGTFGKRSVPALVAGLADPDSVVRGWALEALEKIGPDAGDAVAAVLRLHQHDSEKHVRESAAKALGKIDPERFLPIEPEK
jgi:HEAT repeat protein